MRPRVVWGRFVGAAARVRRPSRAVAGRAWVGAAVVALLVVPGFVSTAASTLTVVSRPGSVTSFARVGRAVNVLASPSPVSGPPEVAVPSPSVPPPPPPIVPAVPVQDPRGPSATVSAADRGVSVAWAAPVAVVAAQFAVSRAVAGGPSVVVATLPGSVSRFLDISVSPGVVSAYSVAALDAAGSTLGVSLPVATTFGGVSSGSGRRFASCPAATVSVGSSAELSAALSVAGPGVVIRLAPGTYSGQFVVGGSGSPGAPVWVCGPRSAVITSGSPSDGHGVTVEGRHDVVLAGFTIRNVLKGVTVVGSQRITVTDVLVEDVGNEAVHLRHQTSESEVTFSTIRRAGLVRPEFGEGIYVGTSDANWCKFNECRPDTTSGIRVFGNVISDTGAQAIEAKAGTSNGVIASNSVSGGRSADAWVTVKGNGWLVADNSGSTSRSYGFATNASVDGWGRDNIFVRNSASGTAKFGTWIHRPDGNDSLGNLVSCLQTVVGTAQGTMNVECRR